MYAIRSYYGLVDPDNLEDRPPGEWQERVLSDRFVPGWLAAKDGSVLAIVVRVKKLNESRERVALEDYFRESAKDVGLRDQLVV